MKNKIFSGILITMAFPICASAVGTYDGLKIGSGNVVLAGSSSAAIGTDNETVDLSLTVGQGNFADDWSLAVGYQNTAISSSFVGGSGSQLSGDAEWNTGVSIVYGLTNRASRIYGTAVFGVRNDVNFDNALGTGDGGEEHSSFVAGGFNRILRNSGQAGSYNVVLGGENTMDTRSEGPGETVGSVLIGHMNTTSKTDSWVLGKGNIGQTGTVTLGTFSSPVADASLIVGNGTSDGLGTTVRSNGLVVLKNGTVKIPGGLILGSEPALTRVKGTGASASSSALAAWGENVTAGNGALALGNRAAANGTDSVAVGPDAKAVGANSSALGSGAGANGVSSMALSGGTAFGNYSLAAAGGQTYAEGAIGMGYAQAVGKSSIAIGHYQFGAQRFPNTSMGVNSLAIGGIRSRAEGLGSFSSGVFTKASSAHSIALGSLNKGDSTSATEWVQTDPLFELGNGYTSDFPGSEPSPSLRSNAITTLKNGQTTLSNKFWVSTTPEVVPAATEASAGEALVVEGHTELKGNTVLSGKTRLKGTVVLDQAQGDISMGIYE